VAKLSRAAYANIYGPTRGDLVRLADIAARRGGYSIEAHAHFISPQHCHHALGGAAATMIGMTRGAPAHVAPTMLFPCCAVTNSVPRFARLVQPRPWRHGQTRMVPSGIPASDSLLVPNVNEHCTI
jgi:urease alpha subunit